jgi:hypothetical protein
MSKTFVTEEMRPEKEWFKEARKQTLETLPKFIDHVMNDYVHDYGTVCHAISACAIAAAWAANECKGACGGITGFQASFVMWDFVKQWSYTDNKTALKILDYDKMLFPQYEDNFQKTMQKATWEVIQAEAKKKLESAKSAHPDVVAHWKSIVAGNVPFGYTVEK